MGVTGWVEGGGGERRVGGGRRAVHTGAPACARGEGGGDVGEHRSVGCTHPRPMTPRPWARLSLLSHNRGLRPCAALNDGCLTRPTTGSCFLPGPRLIPCARAPAPFPRASFPGLSGARRAVGHEQRICQLPQHVHWCGGGGGHCRCRPLLHAVRWAWLGRGARLWGGRKGGRWSRRWRLSGGKEDGRGGDGG